MQPTENAANENFSTAMILAAGRGNRLRPLTDYIPKSLCKVLGKPLIEHHIQNLKQMGIKHIIINHAYLGDQIRHATRAGAPWNVDISYSPEPPGGLETGGGIVNALPLLGNKPFLVINADIFTDYPLQNLALPPGKQAHIILVKKPLHCNTRGFDIAPNGDLRNTDGAYTLAGITIYHPNFFATCKVGRYSLVPLLRRQAEMGLVSASHYDGQWIDIGHPTQLALANHACISGALPNSSCTSDN